MGYCEQDIPSINELFRDANDTFLLVYFIFFSHYKYKYKYNSYFYCAPYSLTDGALQKSANTCFTAVGRLK